MKISAIYEFLKVFLSGKTGENPKGRHASMFSDFSIFFFQNWDKWSTVMRKKNAKNKRSPKKVEKAGGSPISSGIEERVKMAEFIQKLAF